MVAVGTTLTGRRRVEGVVTQRPPPQIVACGFPALRSSEPGSQLSISLKPCSLRAFAGILSSAVATGVVLPGSVSSLLPLTVSGPCFPFQVQALRTPSPCTRLSRAPSTLSPSDFLRLVTRDLRCARLSRRDRSSVSAVSEAAGSPTSTKVPLAACCGSAPRQSQQRLTL